jgi:hypothetical protein
MTLTWRWLTSLIVLCVSGAVLTAGGSQACPVFSPCWLPNSNAITLCVFFGLTILTWWIVIVGILVALYLTQRKDGNPMKA